MHRQIKIVAILLMVEGGLEALMGIFLCVMGPVMMAFMSASPPPATAGGGAPPPPEVFGAIYIGMGAATLIAGILKVVGGIRNVALKSRTLGFVALGSSVLSLASCYCIPTALALGIYGLIVYVNERSAQAFKLVETGMPPEQALAQVDGMTPFGAPPPPYGSPPPGQYPPYPPAKRARSRRSAARASSNVAKTLAACPWSVELVRMRVRPRALP